MFISLTSQNGGVVVGRITRGTTGTNRLRRADRWLSRHPRFRAMHDPLVVDLGYGALPHTTLELADRLAAVQPGLRVVGVEIDPERVSSAQASATDRVSFVRGGFEIPLPENRTADVIRAFNVLRQYDESEVTEIWARIQTRLSSGGIFLDGTCDEIGRVATWVSLGANGPESFTVALRLADMEMPSIAAERLVKALIHRNVEGEEIHRFFRDLDHHWTLSAPLQVYSPRQRWMAAVRAMKASGWPVQATAASWRLGEITVDWDAVAPRR
ncbi:MAG: methyltransferase domain-containing protein [Actinobacteria bacterium]|nr:methyltransferase domain-containing protein [Actinomycetota bacterium]MTA38034.1 methyltransferase domain-containing protein [Actinomycetota bacterium]